MSPSRSHEALSLALALVAAVHCPESAEVPALLAEVAADPLAVLQLALLVSSILTVDDKERHLEPGDALRLLALQAHKSALGVE